MNEKDATLGQGIKLLTLIEQRKVPCEQLQKLFASGLLADLLSVDIDGIDRNAFWQLISLKVYTLIIDYGRNVEDGIKVGKYNWSNKDITSSHFPSDEVGTEEVFIKIVHFRRLIATDEVLSELDKMGLRPASLKELLAFGEKYPDLQKEFPIIALYSVWQSLRGNRFCAYLRSFGSERFLSLDWIDTMWNDNCRFAAVCK